MNVVSLNFLQSTDNLNNQDKQGGNGSLLSWMNEKTKYTHFLCGCKEKPLCFRWVSASVSSRPASNPHPSRAPCHSDRVRHCGMVRYKSSGSGGDISPQIRPTHRLSASVSNPQRSRLADRSTDAGRKSLCPSVCGNCHHKAVKGWWVCVLSYSPIHLYTYTDTK